jgi:hypothetical protein
LPGAGKTTWAGWASDVSRYGISIIAERRFEKGTLLRVLTRDEAHAEEALPLVRVVDIRAADEGKWVAGCVFARNLDEEELSTFLGPAAAWLASR